MAVMRAIVGAYPPSGQVNTTAKGGLGAPRLTKEVGNRLDRESRPAKREKSMCTCDRELYARRRAAFAKAMALRGMDAVAVLPAAPVYTRNNDVEHDYRQDSDLYYMTGVDEPQ